MKSWDVFDTLIARRYLDSEHIWRQMEQDIDIPNFAQNRRTAYYGTINNIYEGMAARGQIPQELRRTLPGLEIQYEEETVFPIRENMVQVNHGDLLVSDMYISPPDILRLVRSAGLDKQVTIHVSLGDKQDGTFWKAMRGHLSVDCHIGDNGHSDIKLAAQEGFKVVHYTKSVQTAMEHKIQDKGLIELAMLVREVRLRNHEPANEEVFMIANQLNLPWLFVCCELLRRKHPNRKMVMLGRDCQLMYKIFNTYFNEQSYYLPFSRRAAFRNPEGAIRYLKAHLPENYMLVDISSTGRTWNKMGEYHVFDIEILHFDYKNATPIPQNFTWFDKGYGANKRGTNLLLEVFNCADHGMLDRIELVNGFPIVSFDKTNELTAELISVIQKPINTAVELRKFYDRLGQEMSQVSEEVLWYFFDVFPRSICQYQAAMKSGILKAYYDKHDVYLQELADLNY